MAKKRYTHQQIRKSLKKDELRDMLNRGLIFSKGNAENLLIAVIILGVLTVLIPMYFRHQAENEVRAASLLERALYTYLQPIKSGDADSLQPNFQTTEEKYKKCREAYGEVFNTYPNTQSARLARLGEANSLFFLGKYSEAQVIYENELAKRDKDLLAPTLRERIGACLENQQKWSEALKIYQAVLNETPQVFNRHSLRLGSARCLIHLGQGAEAKKITTEESASEPGGFWSEAAHEQAQYESGAGK